MRSPTIVRVAHQIVLRRVIDTDCLRLPRCRWRQYLRYWLWGISANSGTCKSNLSLYIQFAALPAAIPRTNWPNALREPQYGHRVGILFILAYLIAACGHQGRLVAVPGTTTNGGSEVRQRLPFVVAGIDIVENTLLLRRPVHHRRLRSGPYDVGTVRHHLRVPEMGAGRDPARRV